jgi:hypothetical protein
VAQEASSFSKVSRIRLIAGQEKQKATKHPQLICNKIKINHWQRSLGEAAGIYKKRLTR